MEHFSINRLLAIETSCDETAAAIVEKQDCGHIKVLGEAVASSQEMHIKTGGVVPEIAAREQLRSIIPIIRQALNNAHIQTQTNTGHIAIDAIAVTQGPGLIGSLLIGVETAKSLAWAWNKPLVPINHIIGHIYANWIETETGELMTHPTPPTFPALCLIVSGGHTELVLMKGHGQFMLIGQTRDDAAGECFDKCARVLGMPYPGGAQISALAAKYHPPIPYKPILPRPLTHIDSLDFSFSGLKAALVREVAKQNTHQLNQNTKQMLAYELELAVVETTEKKVLLAIKRFNPKSVLLCGGVAANNRLREHLRSKILDLKKNIQLFIPQTKYCTDNATMIGAAALYKQIDHVSVLDIKPNPGLTI